MAASEHTPHMNLSQFGPDDRPSWLDDYNTDMRTIDTALTQGGSQTEPLFCTTQVGTGGQFTASMNTPYIAAFFTHEGTIDVDYNTHTIPITKSGYYAISGYADVSDLTLESGDDKSLQLEIKYSEIDGYENYVASIFNKSYETSEIPELGVPQLHSCPITPVIVHLNAGDTVAMRIRPKGNATISGIIGAMYLTIESKTFDRDES